MESIGEFLIIPIISKIDLHSLLLNKFEFLCVLALLILIAVYSIGSGPYN